MSANEFERQVQRQLDRFQLSPSASVWQKVEEEIREKKRRRAIFFILLPVALGLLVFSIYQFWYPGKKPDTSQASLASAKKNIPPASAKNMPEKAGIPSSAPFAEQTSDDQLSSNDTKENKLAEEQLPTNKQGTADNKGTVGVTTGAGFSTSNSSVNKTNRKETVKTNSGPVSIQKRRDNTLAIAVDVPPVQKNTIPDHAPATTDAKDIAVRPSVPAEQEPAVPVTTDDAAALLKKDSTRADEVAIISESKRETIIKNKKVTSKIRWGVDFSTGLTFNNSGTLTFARAEAFDMNYNNPGNVTGVGSAGPSGPPQVIIPPSTVRPGLSFRLGIVAETKVSKRSSFSAGLQYAYSSNRIKIGTVTDTAVVLSQTNDASQTRVNVDKLYSGTPQNNYTNSYHFIQLPVSYQWQVNKSKKWPIRLNATAAVGYLLSTNALLYDGALGGIYYKDKNAYNKMHFNLGAGLSFGWLAKNGGEWVIGPDLSFDMTRLIKHDQQYLMFGGVNTKWFFPKKKNK
jgi:hypothetical protein